MKIQTDILFSTQEQINEYLSQTATSMGFGFYCYAVRFFMNQTQHIDRVISNYPSELLKHYVQNKLTRIDPIMWHCVQYLTPLIWSRTLWVTQEQKALYEKACTFGLKTGVSFPVHRREGDVGVLSFVMSSDDQASYALMHNFLPQGALLVNYVHDAMRKIATTEGIIPVPCKSLTKRELECLKWMTAGKSNWEIAQILQISEHGVGFHVRNLMNKFGVNKRQQVMAAARLGGLL